MKRLMMIHLLIILQLGAYHIVNGEMLSPDSTVKNNSLGLIHSCDSLKERFCQNYEINQLYCDTEMRDGFDGFNTRFYLLNYKLKNVIYNVSMNNLRSLLGLLSLNHYDPKNHVSGIRFSYGISAANELVLILQPVVLLPRVKDSADVIGSDYSYYIDSLGNWIYSTSTDSMTARYINEVRIIHANETVATKFDSLRDTKSCIMTAQEILQEYYDNLINTSASGKDLISFVLLADKMKNNVAKDYKLHVGVLFREQERFLTQNFRGFIADFAELCPTNCSTIKLNVTPK